MTFDSFHNGRPAPTLRRTQLGFGVGLGLLACAHTRAAAPPTDLAANAPKHWRPEFSLSVKEAYDSNVYLSGVDQALVPAGTTTLKERSSWVTTTAVKAKMDLATLLGDSTGLAPFSLAYAPEFAVYHDEPTESYNAHRFLATIGKKAPTWAFNVESANSYIDGDDESPVYPGGLFNAMSICVPRERRQQFQDRTAVSLRKDWGPWFLRPSANLVYYDLMTAQRNVPGYINYADRRDVNGGADVGRSIRDKLAVTLGYRYGDQVQEQYAFTPYSSGSSYQRALVGLEGQLGRWLDFQLQAGPDFRAYEPNTPTHITPVTDHHPVKYFAEGNVTATLSPDDRFSFKYKQYQWVASTGKIPYFDSTFDATYRHSFSRAAGLDLGARLCSADYTSGNVAASNRNDWQTSLSATFNYAWNTHLSFTAAGLLELGHNAQDNVASASAREFTRTVLSIGTSVKF